MVEDQEHGSHLKPYVLFGMTLGAVFLVELLVMLVLPLLPKFSLVVEAFLDAFLLSVLVVPFLYIFFFKPLYRNIELRKQNEIERNKLQRIDLVKSEFISTAAHELRTPIATIMGYTEILSNRDLVGPVTEAQRGEFLCQILESSERLSKIIDDILDVSRIESGQKVPLSPQLLSIEALLEKIVKRLSLKSGNCLTLNVSPTVPRELMFDGYRIEQVVENLVDNAIKYSPKNSRVVIDVDADSRQCSVRVTDQGIGMTDDQIAHIFEKFYRADTSNTATRGLGLGMSIVKQIITDHGGTIQVDSKLGQGTSVCFSLPR